MLTATVATGWPVTPLGSRRRRGSGRWRQPWPGVGHPAVKPSPSTAMLTSTVATGWPLPLVAAYLADGGSLGLAGGLGLVVGGVGVGDRVLPGGQGLGDLTVGVGEPAGRPDAEERPAQALQVVLAEAVAVAGGGSGVVAGAVALDREHEAPWRGRVPSGEVDPVAGAAVLGDQRDPSRLEPVAHVGLERVERWRCGGLVCGGLVGEYKRLDQTTSELGVERWRYGGLVGEAPAPLLGVGEEPAEQLDALG